MAGTLTISTLSDGTNSTSSTNCIQGSAKAWARFNGVTTATVTSSYNVSSITRTGTGLYTVAFTTAFTDGNYSMGGTCTYPSSTAPFAVALSQATTSTASNAYIETGITGSNASAGSALDGNPVCVQFFR